MTAHAAFSPHTGTGAGPGTARDPRLQPIFISPIHRAGLVLVWLMVAASGVVFSEPAPVDLLMFALVLLLPVAGLIRVTPAQIGRAHV